MNTFESNLEHLLAEARRIDLMLRQRVIEVRLQRREPGWDEFRGLCISEEEIDDLLSSAFPADSLPEPAVSGQTEMPGLAEALQQLDQEISERRDSALEAGVELRLEVLKQAFGLTAFHKDVLLVGLLPELDLRYQKLYGYLQDDVTRKAPTVDLALRLLGGSFEERSVLRTEFLPQSPLLDGHLLSLSDHNPGSKTSLLDKALKVDERIVDYLLGSDQIDVRLLPFVRLVQPQVKLSQLPLPPDIKTRLGNLVEADIQAEGAVFYLEGSYGAGKQMTAGALCCEMGVPLLVVDVRRMLVGDLPVALVPQLVLREAALQNAYIYWDRFDLLLSDDTGAEAHRLSVLHELRPYPGIVFLASRISWEPAEGVFVRPFLKVELPVPPFDVRRRLWQVHLEERFGAAADQDLDALANKFRFTDGRIRDAVTAARDLTLGRNGHGEKQVSVDDLYQASRAQSNQSLNSLAGKIKPKYTWEDIVLPQDQMGQLREITDRVRYRHVVYGDWNFDRKVSLGKGLNILFAGPSGTGKTMAAEIIAGELKLDLYKIDLSTVVSKYIGETEKNLDRIFREAQDSNAILFFDEADAIFGKRSEVRDSHDRYANIEIAYLLQKMEEYEGIVVLATNLRKNLDEAFGRRMHFSIEFPQPEEADRLRIWQRVFPQEAPLSGEVDLGFMARQFKVTGGNIKNMALGAAFLAASDGGTICMEHLVRATKREFQKIGRLCTEGDFAKYFDLVKS